MDLLVYSGEKFINSIQNGQKKKVSGWTGRTAHYTNRDTQFRFKRIAHKNSQMTWNRLLAFIGQSFGFSIALDHDKETNGR